MWTGNDATLLYDTVMDGLKTYVVCKTQRLEKAQIQELCHCMHSFCSKAAVPSQSALAVTFSDSEIEGQIVRLYL